MKKYIAFLLLMISIIGSVAIFSKIARSDSADINSSSGGMDIQSLGDIVLSTGAAKTVKLKQSVWRDINLPVGDLGVGAATPLRGVVGTTTIRTYLFAGTGGTPDELHGSLEIPHDYKEGSDIIIHTHSAPSTTGAGNYIWSIEYVWIADNGTVTSSITANGPAVAAGGVAWNGRAGDIVTISGAGHVIGDRFIFRIFRNQSAAGDTYVDSMALYDVGVHYEVDTIGSRQTLIK